MRVLEQLEPKSVFYYFEELSRIPHGSRNTKAVSDYCVRFAETRGLWHCQDEANNVVIKAPASAGYENAAPVILQGHLDMVAEKAEGCSFDFTKDALRLRAEGDFLSADGTTLGGDDGIAAAMMLALLDSPSIPRPAIEAVFTTDEEIGMLGAQALDCSVLQGRRMLNLDSEDEGIFTVSCAGGASAEVSIPLVFAPCADAVFAVAVTGLRGGHSGEEINKGRASSNQLMGRLLDALLQKAPFRLVSAAGGLKDNAIPLRTEALLAVPAGAEGVLADTCREYEAAFRHEFAIADPDIRVTFAPAENAAKAMTEESTRRTADWLLQSPQGVYAMSLDIPGLVQTSCNMGIFSAGAAGLHAVTSVRSSIATQKQMLLGRIGGLARMLEGSLRVTGDYPAWEYKKDSAMRELVVSTYRELFGKEPQVKAIHAGLECGLFSGKLPGLDAVSFGPDMQNIHTSREKLSISSTARTWLLLCQTLGKMKD